jgi:hypothetical protein
LHSRAKLLWLVLPGVLALAAVWGQARQQTPQEAQQGTPQGTSQPAQAATAAHEHNHDIPGHGMQDMDMPENMAMPMPSGNGRGMSPQQQAQAQAMHAMEPGSLMDMAHMRMTALRPSNAEDQKRADHIVTELKDLMERYKDYRVALADGYQIFLPRVPQEEYHFNNYWNGFVEGFTFDPTRPTSLLYKKTRDGGWELTGAMYTAPRTATMEQLDARVPLSVARWHEHVNLCMPQRSRTGAMDGKRFGLTGSITTEEACRQAGGQFYPLIFGWMVHVYPYAAADKIFAVH